MREWRGVVPATSAPLEVGSRAEVLLLPVVQLTHDTGQVARSVQLREQRVGVKQRVLVEAAALERARRIAGSTHVLVVAARELARAARRALGRVRAEVREARALAGDERVRLLEHHLRAEQHVQVVEQDVYQVGPHDPRRGARVAGRSGERGGEPEGERRHGHGHCVCWCSGSCGSASSACWERPAFLCDFVLPAAAPSGLWSGCRLLQLGCWCSGCSGAAPPAPAGLLGRHSGCSSCSSCSS